ncbi:hypothetical protein [Ralstonia pseudosolanacearum]
MTRVLILDANGLLARNTIRVFLAHPAHAEDALPLSGTGQWRPGRITALLHRRQCTLPNRRSRCPGGFPGLSTPCRLPLSLTHSMSFR